MDNRITGTRLKNLLLYDWFKIVLIVVAIVLVWALAFTTGAPRASTGQTFGLLVYNDFNCAKSEGELLVAAKEKGAFSYDVLNLTSRSMDEQYYATLLSVANSVQEGDVIITSNFKEDCDKNESPYRTLIDSYGAVMYDYETLINSAKSYCLDLRAVSENNGEYTLNEDVITQYFQQRMSGDPRFRNRDSEKYAQGIQNEIMRFKQIWNNAVKLEQCLKNHPELCEKYVKYSQMVAALSEEEKADSEYVKLLEGESEKIYGLNLGKLSGGKNNITDLYSVTSGSDETIVSAEGIIICVFDYEAYQYDLQYETLGFVNYLIEEYSNFFDGITADLIA